jgi:APA family basic amino acid/polyamine antiporter
MIGSGVFMLPASLAPYGWNAVIAWLLTIGGALCLAFVYARLAQAFPSAGGPLAYTREAFGPTAGFMVAWAYWISMWVGNAAIAIGGVSYLSVFVPAIAKVPGLAALVTVAIVWLITAINCWGSKSAGRLQVAATILKLLPLIAVAGLAVVILARKGGAAVTPFEPSQLSAGGITAAATLTLWALLGLESATVPADKVREPEKTIPRATLYGTAFTGLIYLVVCSAVVLLSPPDLLKASNAPFADFVGYHGGGDLRLVLAAFAAISAFGALNGWVLLQGEMPYAMARDGVFPAFLAKAGKRGTPMRAHVLSSLLLTGLVLMNYAKSMADLFTFIALLATSASLFTYLFSALAALRLQQAKRMGASMPLTVLAILAAVYSIWTLYGAGASATLWGLVLLVAGLPVRLVTARAARSVQSLPVSDGNIRNG